jgi:hypothetical protein
LIDKLEITYKIGGGISGPGIPIGPGRPGNGTRPGAGGPRRKIEVRDKTKSHMKQRLDHLPKGTSKLVGLENRPPGKKRFLRSVVERFFRPYEEDDPLP